MSNANIKDEFRKFLETYSPDDLGTLTSGAADDARANAIFNRFKDTFELWTKCPEWIRREYPKGVPLEVLSEVAKNPNIADIDSLNKNIATKENQESSPNIEIWESDSLYDNLKAIGIRLEKEQVQKALQRSKEIQKKSYSADCANRIAINEQLLDATYKKLTEIENNPNLSEEERKKQKDEQMKARYNIRKNTVDIAKIDYELNQPERALVRLARDFNVNKVDQKTFEEKASVLIKRIIELGHLPKLSEQLQSPMFKRLKDETKDCLLTLTDDQGLHFKESTKIRQRIQQQTAAASQPSQTGQPVIQNTQEHKYSIPIQRQYEP